MLGFRIADKTPEWAADDDTRDEGGLPVFTREIVPIRIGEHDAILWVYPINELSLIFLHAAR